MAGSVQGQVLNQRDGQPIEGVNLELKPEGGAKSSGSDGGFKFTGLAAGDQYELTATHTGFEVGIYGPLTVVDDMPLKMVIALQPKNI